MALTPTATRDLLARLGHAPKRFLGQNFLVDGNIVRKSLELAAVAPGDAVVEIGPGLGTLTLALLEAGAEVWAIERDRTLHDHLATELEPRFPGRIHLVEGDAVEQPLAGWTEAAGAGGVAAASGAAAEEAPSPAYSPGTGCKVVANLPYAISTPWMDAALSGPLPTRMVLMLQREAAERYAAQPGTRDFGAISIFLQAAYTIAPGHRVSAACFFPRPDVDSSLLHLIRQVRPLTFTPQQKLFIRSCFQQRRKQIGAVVRERLPGRGGPWLEQLAAAGYPSTVRAEAIPVAVWVKLAAVIESPA
jgi:16S rRNA (adenine1518-N6/adenine1519-N6)-dimethyltransferase